MRILINYLKTYAILGGDMAILHSLDDGGYRGEILGLTGSADFYGGDVLELRDEMSKSLSVYVDECRDLGVEPYKNKMDNILNFSPCKSTDAQIYKGFIDIFPGDDIRELFTFEYRPFNTDIYLRVSRCVSAILQANEDGIFHSVFIDGAPLFMISLLQEKLFLCGLNTLYENNGKLVEFYYHDHYQHDKGNLYIHSPLGR